MRGRYGFGSPATFTNTASPRAVSWPPASSVQATVMRRHCDGVGRCYSILSRFSRLCLPQSNWILRASMEEPPFEKGITWSK